STLEHISRGVEVSLRLRHLLALDEKEAHVKPKAREMLLAGRAARLRDLAFMMREDQILAAGVDIDDLAPEHRHRHDRALDVPAWITRSPRRIPLHDVRGVGLPEQEVLGATLGALLLLEDSSARSRAQRLDRVAAQLAVSREALDRIVHGAI